MNFLKNINIKTTLILIFLLALVVRFLYFPNDIYFAYDQARDAYTSLEILKGDFKIIGPPATFQGVYHGALFYYIFAPLYYFSKGSPDLVSMFLRIYNAAGLFLLFFVAKKLFNKWVGLVSALIYAVSFEESQYSLFVGHPSLAVPAVLLFYLGLTIFLFERRPKGLILALLGFGLSIQFHFSMISLFPALILVLLVFCKDIPKTGIRTIIYSLSGFILATSTYVLSELKFNFRATRSILGFIFGSTDGSASPNINNLFYIPKRFIHDNLYFDEKFLTAILIILAFSALLFIYLKKYRKQTVFLSIWFFTGIFPYLFDHASLPIYYYSIGSSIVLIIFSSFMIYLIFGRSKILGILAILLIILSNLKLITTFNSKGTLPEINVQDGMLLGDEKKVIDFAYQNANGEEFSLNGLTNPYNVNTTWSYLFESYGLGKFGYLPVWGGDTADGFPGNLKIARSFSDLPGKRFVIIEPTRGVRPHLINQFFANEEIFSKVIKQAQFGKITVQERALFDLQK